MPHPVLAVDCCEFFAEPGGLVAPVQWTADIGRNKPSEEFYWFGAESSSAGRLVALASMKATNSDNIMSGYHDAGNLMIKSFWESTSGPVREQHHFLMVN